MKNLKDITDSTCEYELSYMQTIALCMVTGALIVARMILVIVEAF